MRIRNLLFILLSVIAHYSWGQNTLTIRQSGLTKTDSIPHIDIVEVRGQIPKRINDTTIQFEVPVTEDDCLSVLLGGRWFTRVWIEPIVKHKELIVDYRSKSAHIVKGTEIDQVLEQSMKLEREGKPTEKDSLSESYITTHPDEYFSLWLLTHGCHRDDPKKNIPLLRGLGENLKTHSAYELLQKNIYGRQYPKKGDRFQEFSLRDRDSILFNSKSIRNKVLVLHFWSNSCGPCVRGMNSLVSFYTGLDTSLVQFISIGLDQDETQWRSSTTTRKIIWPNLWTKDGTYCDLCLRYNLMAMPYFVIFDSFRRITYFNDGEDIDILRSKIDDAINNY